MTERSEGLGPKDESTGRRQRHTLTHTGRETALRSRLRSTRRPRETEADNGLPLKAISYGVSRDRDSMVMSANVSVEPRCTTQPTAVHQDYIPTEGHLVPSKRLKEEADKKRAALARVKELEQRVRELEEALKSVRSEWQFRRKSTRSLA
jgi:hypothetical protein